MGGTGVIDRFLEVFTRYIDSGFGLLQGEVKWLAGVLIAIDLVLAALFWAMAPDEDVIARLVKKTLFIGVFAYIINNWTNLARIVFESFAGLGLKASGTGLSEADFLRPGRVAQVGLDAGKPILDSISGLMGFVSFFENFIQIAVLLFAWAIVILAFFILAIQLFVSLIEFKLTTLAGFVLIPFGLFNKTAFAAERVLGNVMSSGIKVLVLDVPRFSRIARSYLLHIGGLDWTKINPDIFGSMIQAVADDEERGALGMHYTSVPNILKVLNPLFLDDLRETLAEAGDNSRKLLNLRNRMARIRVFDPACGSGNFLVIAYKQMREIEATINARRGEPERPSDIPLTNFRGIELRDFPAEVARLALIIAEYQADVLYRGQKLALAEFLPLDAENWITCGNALRLDWLSICPPTGTGVKHHADDLFHSPLDQAQIDFENEGGETYICGNPPYKGTKYQSSDDKSDIKFVFDAHTTRSGTLDYVAGWFFKAAEYARSYGAEFAFVSTNSVCQGGHVPVLWPLLFTRNLEIGFAFQSFKWRNLASHNAGVIVVVVGLRRIRPGKKRLFQSSPGGDHLELSVDQIGPYLIPGTNTIVEPSSKSISGLAFMALGNAPYDGGHLILSAEEVRLLGWSAARESKWLRPLLGSAEIIDGVTRQCLWIEDRDLAEAEKIPEIKKRVDGVRTMRLSSTDAGTRAMATRPHQFREMNFGVRSTIAVPLVSSETREFLTPDLIGRPCSMTNKSYALYDADIMNLAVISSRLHVCWIATVCGRMKTDYSYSNKMGWNTFPVPPLTEKNKTDLTRCAEDILLAREAHYPATIADLYDPDIMPTDLRAAHDRNDEVLERIYIGRRFRNDTERLEKLFELYTKMTAGAGSAKKPKARANA